MSPQETSNCSFLCQPVAFHIVGWVPRWGAATLFITGSTVQLCPYGLGTVPPTQGHPHWGTQLPSSTCTTHHYFSFTKCSKKEIWMGQNNHSHTSDWEKKLEPRGASEARPLVWWLHHPLLDHAIARFFMDRVQKLPSSSRGWFSSFQGNYMHESCSVVLYLSCITTYLVAYKKTTIGWILTENKRLCVSLPALRRCSESWFPLPVCFNHSN